MTDTYRSTVAALALAVLLVASGCGQLTGGTSGPEYQGNADEYLLTADTITGWEENVTREPTIDTDRIESGRVIELVNGSSEVQLSVLVFPAAADAATFMSEQRVTYRENDLDPVNRSLGDEAIEAEVTTGTFLEVRESNVYVQVVGNVRPDTARQFARAQLRKVRES